MYNSELFCLPDKLNVANENRPQGVTHYMV